MKQTIEPIIIQKLGISGRIKDTHFGILLNGKPTILPNVDTLDDLLKRIDKKLF
jgi:hypothetical protein